jgi:hypothetical protein
MADEQEKQEKKVIEHLTEENKAKIPEYIKKWLDVGTSTERINPERAQWISDYFYEKLLKLPKVPVVICDGPIAAWQEVCNHVNGGKPIDYVYPYIDGSFDGGYFAFFDYCQEVLGAVLTPDLKEKYEWYKATTGIGLFFPLDDVCIISQKPIEIHIEDRNLSADRTPAIAYADGFKIYSLHGITVPQWLAETPAELLDPKKILTDPELKDVDVRREFIKKIGIQRCLKELGWKPIDAKDNYELGTVEVIDGSPRVYLKMENPSLPGIWHVEAVHPDCKTVQDAINWRAQNVIKEGEDWEPSKLT